MKQVKQEHSCSLVSLLLIFIPKWIYDCKFFLLATCILQCHVKIMTEYFGTYKHELYSFSNKSCVIFKDVHLCGSLNLFLCVNVHVCVVCIHLFLCTVFWILQIVLFQMSWWNMMLVWPSWKQVSKAPCFTHILVPAELIALCSKQNSSVEELVRLDELVRMLKLGNEELFDEEPLIIR